MAQRTVDGRTEMENAVHVVLIMNDETLARLCKEDGSFYGWGNLTEGQEWFSDAASQLFVTGPLTSIAFASALLSFDNDAPRVVRVSVRGVRGDEHTLDNIMQQLDVHHAMRTQAGGANPGYQFAHLDKGSPIDEGLWSQPNIDLFFLLNLDNFDPRLTDVHLHHWMCAKHNWMPLLSEACEAVDKGEKDQHGIISYLQREDIQNLRILGNMLTPPVTACSVRCTDTDMLNKHQQGQHDLFRFMIVLLFGAYHVGTPWHMIKGTSFRNVNHRKLTTFCQRVMSSKRVSFSTTVTSHNTPASDPVSKSVCQVPGQQDSETPSTTMPDAASNGMC